MIYQLRFTIASKGNVPVREHVERTIEAAGSCTLEQLMSYLLDSLGFDFDHRYAFFDGSREYEGGPPDAPYDERCKAKILKLGLKEGDRFDAVYDFGDEWAFDVQVLEVRDEKGGPPQVTDRIGEIDQYPDEEELARQAAEWEAGEEGSEGTGQDLHEGEFYVVSDELFDAAFRYKETRLWKRFKDSEIFALRFSDGETGFVSIMGKAGDHCALGVYVGEEAFNSLRRLLFRLPDDEPLSGFERMLQQDCLQMAFDIKAFLLPGEEDAVRAYAEPRGIRFRGKNAFPVFKKFIPGRIPWHVRDPKDERYLIEAAEAAIQLSKTLGSGLPGQLGIWEHQLTDREVPCVRIDVDPDPLDPMSILGEPVRIGPVPLRRWPAPTAIPRARSKRLRRLKARGEWECRIALLKGSIDDHEHPDLPPYFPLALMLTNRTAQDGLPPFIMETAEPGELDPDQARDHILGLIEEKRKKPAAFIVADERTRALIAPIAEQIDCELRIEEDLPLLDEALERMNYQMQMDEIYGDDPLDPDDFDELVELAGEIAALPAETFRTMNLEVRRDLMKVIEMGILPADVEQMLRRKLKR